MLITTDLLTRIEQIPDEEMELTIISKESIKIAKKIQFGLMENYRFKAGEEKILIASEIISGENVLKIYYTYSGKLIIKDKEELYFQLNLSEFDTIYYCLFARVLANSDKYEFGKEVNKMYYDKKLARIGEIIFDIYNVLFKE